MGEVGEKEKEKRSEKRSGSVRVLCVATSSFARFVGIRFLKYSFYAVLEGRDVFRLPPLF